MPSMEACTAIKIKLSIHLVTNHVAFTINRHSQPHFHLFFYSLDYSILSYAMVLAAAHVRTPNVIFISAYNWGLTPKWNSNIE